MSYPEDWEQKFNKEKGEKERQKRPPVRDWKGKINPSRNRRSSQRWQRSHAYRPGICPEEIQGQQELLQRLEEVLGPLPERLDAYVDKRLVTTFIELMTAIITCANPKSGLHLSRIRSINQKWSTNTSRNQEDRTLASFGQMECRSHEGSFVGESDKKGERLKSEGKQVLCIHDGSRLEKPESEQTEGLCAVLSSKAKRLRKIRAGVWNPPTGKPITV